MICSQRLLQTFLDYVRIDSESGHEGAFAARLKEDLGALGCAVYEDNSRSQTGSDTGNLYVALPATAPGQPILLSAHMDTVKPGVGIRPVVENGVIRSSGDTVLGADDKCGVAAIMEVLRTLVERELPHREVRVLFTVCEEGGVRGSRYVEYERLRGCRALVLDCSGDAGTIVTAAPGQDRLTATVIGRGAHAGISPEKGISAVQVLAEAIAGMKLLRVDEETTANIGGIHADYSTNIVPPRATLKGEARSRNEAKLTAQSRHMVHCLQQACGRYGARLEYTLERAYCAFSFEEEDPFVQEVVRACRRIGLKSDLTVSGGGSDANNFNARGVPALVLGIGMSRVHTTQEELSIANLENTARLVLEMTLAE